jgi:SsrA-binding protein
MKVVVQNKKARHDFSILETLEAGIALRGTEVKSLREGRANLRDSYALLEGGEVLLRGLQIMPYSHTSDRAVDPMRDRKLLLNREEIRKLTVKINGGDDPGGAQGLLHRTRHRQVELGPRGQEALRQARGDAERETHHDVDRAIKRARNE